MNKLIKLLMCMLTIWATACQQDPKEQQPSRPAVDPSKIKIDIEAGAIHTADGVLIMYKKAGSGEQTVVVPNLTYIDDGLKALEDTYTVIYYDARNRGRSQAVMNGIQLKKGIQNDVNDLETLRQHFKLERLNIIGHGYYGLMAAVYGLEHPDKLGKIVMLNPYPNPLDQNTGAPYTDALTQKIEEKLDTLNASKASMKDLQYCESWWEITKMNYVAMESKSRGVDARICKYPNELPDRQMAYQENYIKPSLEKISYKKEDFKQLQVPILILWGQKDRLYGENTAKNWKALLPDATITNLKEAGNMSWVEAKEELISAIKGFL